MAKRREPRPCPTCNVLHQKKTTFCSQHCSNKRPATAARKQGIARSWAQDLERRQQQSDLRTLQNRNELIQSFEDWMVVPPTEDDVFEDWDCNRY